VLIEKNEKQTKTEQKTNSQEVTSMRRFKIFEGFPESFFESNNKL
jgi:hypothetical protein